MELATTQSVLMQIQPTIQRFARMLASVLQLEVEIVDENLCRVAGTGAYGKFLGRQLSGNSRLLRHVLETKTEKVVTQSRFDPLCEGCDSKENCREKAFLGTPVTLINMFCWAREKRIQEDVRDQHCFATYSKLF